ncbi:hypothetical protein F5Y16DRAFT_376320 [Xylariaceae sp. FL0255]|nr:hypothetical protein F5Y16DRAFT_376320 [Xylariaceae sp. FL0255]
MASIATPRASVSVGSDHTDKAQDQKPALSDEDASPLSEGEEPFGIDQDTVQSMIQPALSPVATRLTFPNTPAAEKAAAMEHLPGGALFDVIEDDPASPPLSRPPPPKTRSQRGFTLGSLPANLPNLSYINRLPSPWQSGPKELVIDNESSSKPALSGVFGHHQRSSSGGQDTLKRIRDALPSISLPAFFSGPSLAKSTDSEAKRAINTADGASSSRELRSSPGSEQNRRNGSESPHQFREGLNATFPPPASRLRTIRRSTSDESLLYSSLSRVSSYGDDQRWDNMREQKNSRLKAITDSWDRPTFKLPQLPNINILPESLKKHPFLNPEGTFMSTSHIGPSLTVDTSNHRLSELDRALESLTGDIVVMGGYRGSILRSTKTKRQVWVPVKVGLNIRKVNLEVGLDYEDEEKMEDTIYSSGMLQNIGPVDISKRLFKRLRECENAKNGKLRVWDYGYDWRLSPHLLSRKLIDFLQELPSNQGSGESRERGVTVVAHSLGGIITRHAVNQRPELFAGVVYAGTPQRCINVLGPLRNGDAVLFNEKVLTAQVNFSLRTTFVFLPEDGFCFINKHTGEKYQVDFYDPEEWAKYAWSPCIETPLPAYNSRFTARSSFRELSDRIPSPLRSRGNSSPGDSRPSPSFLNRTAITDAVRKIEVANDRTLAPHMGTISGEKSRTAQQQRDADTPRGRSMAYLTRTLAETKKFRAETQHEPRHTESNSYPPLALIYGKDVPTVWAAHVSSRDAIACSDAYEDLVFRSGDGVVLAKEAMLPEGYELVRGGRISTDRGHITMLGDLEAVGRALQAVIRGRRKGIGLRGVSVSQEKDHA